MSAVPDVVHLPVQEALRVLAKAGFAACVQHTAPPRGPIDGVERVVRVLRRDDGTLVVTTAFYPTLDVRQE